MLIIIVTKIFYRKAYVSAEVSLLTRTFIILFLEIVDLIGRNEGSGEGTKTDWGNVTIEGRVSFINEVAILERYNYR